MLRLIQTVLIAVSLTLIIGCSNNDDSSSAPLNGTVTFFHNVENAGTLQLKAVNTSARNSYGFVDFELFSSPVFLTATSWGLELVDDNDTLATYDDTTVLDNVSFSVSSNRSRIVAFTGTYTDPSTNNLELHQLDVAYDADYLDGSDDYLQYINVSHVHKDLAPTVAAVDVYFVEDENTCAGFDPNSTTADISNLAFGETSQTIILDDTDPNYCLVIAEAGTATKVFSSGPQELQDYLQQSLLISPNHSGVGSSDITLFYYGNGFGTPWQDLTGLVGSMRAYNGVTDSVDMDVVADNGTDNYLLQDNSTYGDISSFTTGMTANSDTYSLIAYNDSDNANTPILNIFADLMAAEQWTAIFYGTTSDTKAMRVLENFNANSTRASVTVSNAAYYADPDDEKAFDIYIKKSSQSLANTDPAFSELWPGSYGNKRFVGDDYQLLVTEAGTSLSVYPFPPSNKTLVDGTNYHYVIIKDPINGGYKLDLIHESP